MSKDFDGGCLCGAIRYRSSSPPVRGVICHCSMCRRHSGAPALAFVHFPRDEFLWLHGEPTRYRSSANASRGFCPTCGSTLDMFEDVLSDRVQVTVGSLDHPELVTIDDHVWTHDQISWFRIDDRLPRFPGSSAAVASKAQQGGDVLSSAALVGFVATAKVEAARQFYQSVLGLRLVEDGPFALVFDANGTMLRVQKVERVAPVPYTALGWAVRDIRAAVAQLAKKGVMFQRFEGMPQDELAIWQAPGGAMVAWFRDPDGNTLSLSQH